MTEQTLTPVADPLAMVDVDQLGALLGVSRRSIFGLKSAGLLPPAIKVGRRLRWRRCDIARWQAWGCPDLKTFKARVAAEEGGP